jgi:hypothetical protein
MTQNFSQMHNEYFAAMKRKDYDTTDQLAASIPRLLLPDIALAAKKCFGKKSLLGMNLSRANAYFGEGRLDE